MKRFLVVLSLCLNLNSFSQIFTTSQIIGGVINDYAVVTAIDLSTNSFTVDKGSFFSDCNKVLIIQMKGATVDESESASFGDISSIGNAGNYEVRSVKSVVGNVVSFSDLTNSYDVSGKVQLIPIPEYQGGATINSTLTCSSWNGASGGVLIFEATSLTMDGAIDVTGKGFRAGKDNSGNIDKCSISEFTDSRNTMLYRSPSTTKTGAEKGEGIGESSFMFSIGKLGSGGGGGGLHNGSGGGGSNFGLGGSGGLGSVNCPSTNPQGAKGQGASSLASFINSGKIFLGGGGGAGQGNNGGSSPSSPNANNDLNYGGDGGGIIFIKAEEVLTTWTGNNYPRNGGNISIIANGESAPNKVEAPQNTVYYDGAGGGGGGGTVILDVGSINTSLANKTLEIEVLGGRGGDTQSNQDCYAPGGGGGGGVVFFTSQVIPVGISAVDVSGGVKGDMHGGQENTSACQISRENTGGGDGDVIYDFDNIISACCPTLGEVNIDQATLSLCESNTVDNLTASFTALNSGTTISDYNITWYKDGELINGQTGTSLSNAVIKDNGSGSYSLSIELKSSSSCVFDSQNIEVNLLAIPTISISDGAAVCDGTSAQLPIVFGGTGPWNFTYADFEGVQKTASNISLSPYNLIVTDLGDYTLNSVSDNNCTSLASGVGTFVYLEKTAYTVDTQCELQNSALAEDEYQIIVKITSGDLNSIQVLETTNFGVTFSRIRGSDEWISTSINEEDEININVTDVNNCGGGTPYSGITRVCSCPTTGAISLTGQSLICPESNSSLEVSFQDGIGLFNVTLLGSVSGVISTQSNVTSPVNFVVDKEEEYSAEIENVGDNCIVAAIGFVELFHEEKPVAVLSGVDDFCSDGSSKGKLNIALEGDAPWTIVYYDGFVNTTVLSSLSFYEIESSIASVYSLVSVTDASSCAGDVSGSGEIRLASSPMAIINESDATLCPEDELTLTITPVSGVQYVWQLNGVDVGVGERVQLDNGSLGGSYTVIADNDICVPVTSIPVFIDRISMELDVVAKPAFVELDGEFSFEVVTNGDVVTWEDQLEGLNETGVIWLYKPKEGGYRTIIVEATKGQCTIQDEFNILVSQPLNIPNAFSPNGDGINDYWEIVGLEQFENNSISIFNRWGAKIHQHFGSGEGRIWDGGNYPVGTYYFVMTMGDEQNSTAQGSITITK